MARPMYETQADRNNEQRVAELLAERGYSLDKLPISFGLDVAITDDFEEKIVAFAEIKARTFEMNKYPTAMINLHKVIRAHDISACTGLPSYFIVLYRDALVRINFASEFAVRHAESGHIVDHLVHRDFPKDHPTHPKQIKEHMEEKTWINDHMQYFDECVQQLKLGEEKKNGK